MAGERLRTVNQRGAKTRDALLAAAEDELGRLSLGELLAGLNASRVSRAAELPSQGPFFHHFGNQERWAAAVARHFARFRPVDDDTAAVAEHIAELADQFRAGDTPDWLAGVRAAADLDWKIVTADLRYLDQQLLVWIARDRPLESGSGATERAGELVAGVYRSIGDRFAPVYGDLLEAWGRKVRPDLTVGDVSVVLTALIEGLVLRWAVEPEAVPDDLYGRIVTSLVPVVSVDVGSDAHSEEHLARIGSTKARRGSANAGAIVAAAETLGEHRPWSSITVNDIAGEAGIASSVVYDEFGSKEALGARLWRRHHLALRAYVVELVGSPVDADPLDLVRLALDRLVVLARHDRDITAALLATLTAETVSVAEEPPPADDIRRQIPVPGALLPVVDHAQQRGRLRGDLDAREVAATLANVTLLHAMTRPHLPSHQVAAYVQDILLNGLAVRP